MSDEELRKLREQRMRQMQEQAAQAQAEDQMVAAQAQQQAQYDAQIKALLTKILSSDARSRLTNIRMTRPQFARILEAQLIQLFQRGSFGNNIPLSDEQFKQILIQIQNKTKKRQGQIKFK